MLKVLITGASGFIGSHLVDKFLERDFEVIGIDNFLTGNPKTINNIMDNPRFKFIEHNIIKPIKIKEKIHLVLHFASPASPIDYLNYPIDTLKVGSLGTYNTLKIALDNNSRYILASTSEIYGDPILNPQSEEYWGNVNPVGPRSVYDEAKRFSEAFSMAYYREYDLDVRIARIFNTYGPRMRPSDGRVVPNFIYQALRNENLTVYGKGTQTRSFCFIKDLVNAIFKLSSYDNLNGEVINLGNPKEYKIIELANIILEKTNSSSEIIFRPLPQDDPKQRCPDISKAKNLLNWRPKTALDIGLSKTIDFFIKSFF